MMGLASVVNPLTISSKKTADESSAQDAKHTNLVVPFIGGFSSGKSSLINALLGGSLLATDITPETALPFELTAGKKLSAKAHTIGGEPNLLSAEQIAQANYTELAAANGWISIQTPYLSKWPNLTLVDLPGWSSGASEHELQLDAFLTRLYETHLDTNLLFALSISADEGTLRDSLREKLATLELGNAKYILVLTKVDKKTEQDISSVETHIQDSVAAVLGKQPDQVFITSARKKDMADLSDYLDALQNELNKKSSVLDKEKLKKSVQEHIDKLTRFISEFRDYAEDVADEVWWEIYTKTAESCFSNIDYRRTSLEGNLFRMDVVELYKRIITEKFDKVKPEIDGAMVESLKALAVSVPDGVFHDEKISMMAKELKPLIDKALEKAKPGLFGSKNHGDAGRRVYFKVWDMEKQYLSIFKAHARQAYYDWHERESDGWKRVRDLL